MQIRSLALAVATTLALTASALSQTAVQPSEPSPAERLGPQFLYGWSAEDVETVRKALHKLEGQGGIDDYLLARQARILKKIEQGFTFYDHNWQRTQLTLQDAGGKPWGIFQMTLPEVVLTGFAISRDRYCRPEEQDMDEEQAKAYCEAMNRRANDLFKRIENLKHSTPGGAR